MPKFQFSNSSFTCPHCGQKNDLTTTAPVDMAKVVCSQCGKRAADDA